MATGFESEVNNTFAQRDVFTADIRTIDASLLSPGDVDFFSFQGLAAGTTYVAETVFLPTVLNQVFDTVIQRHDDAGIAIVGERDDDSGEFNLSRLQGTIGSPGTLNLSIFTNPGSEQQGVYRLELRLTLNGTAGADLRSGSDYAEVFAGLAGNDTLVGRGGNDTIDAGDGDDVVNAGTGDDRAQGGGGNDRLNGDAGVDTVDGGGGNDTLTGGAGNDSLLGGLGADSLIGNVDADTFDGGTGLDTLDGGAGDDLYVLNDADSVVEAAGGGLDTIRSSLFSVTLAANVERLELLGGGEGIGNELANTLINGNTNRFNTLRGEGGNDTLLGGNDMFGGAGDDSLVGGGFDTLDGGEGTDTMAGGSGNDVYVVDAAGDVVIELPDGGFDRVTSTVEITVLADNVEILTLEGGARNGTGNAVGNFIDGNDAANNLLGLDGDDDLEGEAGADTLDGGRGDDTLDGGAANDSLRGGDGADSMAGGTGNDRMIGGAGNDLIVGEAGNDRLEGGSGDDSVIGDGGNNLLLGGDGDDIIVGGSGADTLVGGAGNDFLGAAAQLFGNPNVLIGGLGADDMQVNNRSFDRIVYETAADSTVAARDTLNPVDEFDAVDLSAIDAIAGGDDDSFELLGVFRGTPAAAFSAEGQVRLVFSGFDGLIQANLDADFATIEMEIALNDFSGAFGAGNLIL